MTYRNWPALLLLAFSASAAAPALPVALAPSEIVAAAPAADWMGIAPSDLLVMDLAPDAQGKHRQVVIQLMPAPFSQGWIGNMRKLAVAHWWDGTSVNRVQDNYVAQWGDGDAEDKVKARVLPSTLIGFSGASYEINQPMHPVCDRHICPQAPLSVKVIFQELSKDQYADSVGFGSGWPLAFIEGEGTTWPVHCYGTVGVGRDMPPDTGSGAELYAVIGHAPRHLDRNIAVVGRVIEGIEFLSSLPRGTGALGFYETAAERVPIVSIRIGDTVPELPHYEYLSTESASFARYADARANRRDPFFIVPAGGADICNVPVPVRRVGGGGK